MDKALATKMIHDITLVWNEKLVSKRFLIVYGKTRYEYAQIVIEKNKLLHLVGADTSLTADTFFKKSLSNELSDKQYHLSPSAFDEKLAVLHRNPDFILNSTKIGFSTGSSYYVKFDFAFGPYPIIAFFAPNGKTGLPVSLQNRPLSSVAKNIKDIKAIFGRPMEASGPFSMNDLIVARNGFQKEMLDPAIVLFDENQ